MRLLELDNDITFLKFDDEWKSFFDLLSTTDSKEEILNVLGISPELYEKIIRFSVLAWRNSPTESLLQSLGFISGSSPKGNIFPDLIWQTRFLIKAGDYGFIKKWNLKPVMKNGERVKVNNTIALTVAGEIENRLVNKIIRVLYLYTHFNKKQTVKLPKTLYRGIRASDLFNHENFSAAVSVIWQTDKNYDMKRKEVFDLLIRWICEKKLHQIANSKLLSFTASLPIANYFANGEGLILKVDPKKVEIITSELHDSNLASPDEMTGKMEKEYIVRIPEDYDFKPDDIIISDVNYFIAEQNPLCVALFDHNDKSATYEMDGISITVFAYWRSNDKLSIEFQRSGDSFTYKRAEFKKMYGFDPMPTPQNLHKIKNFIFQKRDMFGRVVNK